MSEAEEGAGGKFTLTKVQWDELAKFRLVHGSESDWSSAEVKLKVAKVAELLTSVHRSQEQSPMSNPRKGLLEPNAIKIKKKSKAAAKKTRREERENHLDGQIRSRLMPLQQRSKAHKSTRVTPLSRSI